MSDFEMDTLQSVAGVRGLGGSDMKRVWEGDWFDLWAEKTGRKSKADLDWEVRVQIGRVTEDLNKRFYRHKTGRPVLSVADLKGPLALTERRSPDHPDTLAHPHYPWMLGRLDGISFDWEWGEPRVLEAKHTSSWAFKDEVAWFAGHAPQAQWYLEISGLQLCDFTVFVDNGRHELRTMARDDKFIGQLMEQGERFFWHVVNDRAPDPDIAPSEPKAVKVWTPKKVSMRDSNAWAIHARTWRATRTAHDQCREADRLLKELVPDDATEAEGHGVRITRSKAGALKITEDRKWEG